jgi:hypothetical protein
VSGFRVFGSLYLPDTIHIVNSPHTYIHTYTHTHTSIYIHTHTHTYIHTDTDTNTRKHTHTHPCTHTFLSSHHMQLFNLGDGPGALFDLLYDIENANAGRADFSTLIANPAWALVMRKQYFAPWPHVSVRRFPERALNTRVAR